MSLRLDMNNASSLQQLNGLNYISRKSRMMIKLKRKKLWNLIIKDDPDADKEMKDAALGLIGEYCSEDYLEIVCKHDSPYEAWKDLEEHFKKLHQHTLRVVTPLLNQFKWNGINVQSNYDNFHEHVRKFKGSGGNRSEYELALDFLRYCPKVFPVGSIRNLPDLTLLKVKNQLETELNEMGYNRKHYYWFIKESFYKFNMLFNIF